MIYLTPKQSNIYQWGWQPNARYRTAVCGRRFGKTYLAAAEIKRAYRQAVEKKVHPDNEIWYGAPTFKQAKRVFWRRLKRAIPARWRLGKPNESECSIVTITGHVIRIVGLENYDDLRGSGLWFFVGDEWADCKYAAWEEVIRPMLSTSQGHALFIGTPKGFNHFFDFYQLGQAHTDNHKSWLYTTIQGGNVPPEEVDHARRSLDALTFRQEYEATFENFSGRVYHAFVRANNVKSCAYDPAIDVHVGMDFNVNPMTATVWQERLTNEGVTLWQVDEIVLPTSNTHEMSKELVLRYGRPGFGDEPGVNHIHVYPDPAGAQRRTSAQGKTDLIILCDYGFHVVALMSHPLVRDRINYVNGQFQSADGICHAFIDPRCRRSIETYERLVFREGSNDVDKNLTYQDSSTMTMDHIGDATGYYMFARFGNAPVRRINVGHTRR